MAFIFVQHLDPDHDSMLVDLIARHTRLKVLSAKHRMIVEPDQIYVIPPGKYLTYAAGKLLLQSRAHTQVHWPIDFLFNSLAEKASDHLLVGVLLSGNASDGTRGMKAIRSVGGVTLAQNKSAKFEGMPQSAIAEGVVDKVLSPKQLAHEITRIAQHSTILRKDTVKVKLKPEEKAEDDLVGEILSVIKKNKQVDFTHYKKNTILRRIHRRMLLRQCDSMDHYLNFIKKNPDESDVLYKDLLINVTAFFRDDQVTEYLKKYPGTGIGLAVCRRVVDNHKGVIDARSGKEGAEFHIILPMKQN